MSLRLLTAFALVAVVLLGGFAGWYGPLVTCGADAAPLCVTWPGVASAAVWLAFVGFIAALVAWQVWMWRRD